MFTDLNHQTFLQETGNCTRSTVVPREQKTMRTELDQRKNTGKKSSRSQYYSLEIQR